MKDKADKIELLDESNNSTEPMLNDAPSHIGKTNLSGANLLRNVDKSYDPGRKSLDENKKFTKFVRMAMSKWQIDKEFYRVRTSPYLTCGRFSCALWRVVPPFAEDGIQRKYGGISGIVRLQSAIRLQQN